MQHQREWLTERFDEQARRDVRNNHHRNHPAKNQPEKPRKNNIRITRNIKKVEIAIYQALRTDDPKAHRGQAEHNGVMNRDAETKRDNIKQNRKRGRHDAQLEQRNDNHDCAKQRVDDAVERELFRGHRELAVDWQDQNGIQFSGAHELGNVRDVYEKERLEELRDNLVCADQQDHFPFCPVTNAIDISKNDAEENDLAAEPQNLHHHPQQEVRLEAQVPDERVAQHDGIDFDVTAHHLWLSLICTTPSIDRLAMLSEAKHLQFVFCDNRSRNDDKFKAWPRPESIRGCVAASFFSE